MSWINAAAWASSVLAVCITIGFLVYRIRKGAIDGVRADSAEQTAKVKDEQLQIAANRPDADGVDGRLRDGTF